MVAATPHKDLENRRPVWNALSELYLDAELDACDKRYLARVLASSPYSLLELSEILSSEVHPVVHWNLRCVAGAWSGFDPEWLEEQILDNLQRKPSWWRRWLPSPVATLELVDPTWSEIRSMVHALRSGADPEENGP